MKPLIRATALLLTLGSPAYGQTGAPSGAAARIEQHVYDLADDSMMGRVLGNPGYIKAARYVATVLRNAGVGPAFYEAGASLDGYFHEFDIDVETIREPARGTIAPSGRGTVRTYNVVGIVPGSDRNRREELIVVGAHLDHVGWPNQREIYNGASDNASGVAAVLEVARRVAHDPAPQSVLFVFFGAEEVGKLGSLAFVGLMNNADADVRAYINVDDVGHLGRGSNGRPLVTILHGKFACPAMIASARAIGDELDFDVSDIDRKGSFTRSDHFSFFQAGIPVLFFTSGNEYDEYHQPTDIPALLDYELLGGVADLVSGVVRAVTENAAGCAVLQR